MDQCDQRAPTQEHFNHSDQSVYRNESFSDVSGTFTICTDANYTRSARSMLFQCTYEEIKIHVRTSDSHFDLAEGFVEWASYK